MKISNAGLQLLTSFEGCRLNAYKCVDTEKYYTIGYGHYGADVKADMKITADEARQLLKKDVEKFEKKVDKYSSYNFTQSEFDALVSFCYNIGNIDGLTKKGTRTKSEIADAFLLYTKSGGKELAGLVRRRKAEREMFVGSSRYYPAYDGKGSIVDALKAIGVDSSFEFRKKIATKNSISNYKGYASQNLTMLALLKKGMLIKV